MKPALPLVLCLASLLGCANLTLAQEAVKEAKPAATAAVVLPPGVTEEMLAPPPVPGFMLKKPAKPLTMDEMVQQAREAEKKAAGSSARPASAPVASEPTATK